MPARGGQRIGKAKALEFYRQYIKPEERADALLAAQHYAAFCQKEDRIPMDPLRFIHGQKGELWREFIQQPASESKCAYANEPCDEYAIPPSRYCQQHKDVIERAKASRFGLKAVNHPIASS